jgi:hypothetical protein
MAVVEPDLDMDLDAGLVDTVESRD